MGFRDVTFGEGRLQHLHQRHRPPWRARAWEGAPWVGLHGAPGQDGRSPAAHGPTAFALAQQTVEVMCSGNCFAPAVSS